MSDNMQGTATLGRPGGRTGDESDYRVRELEARLGRRLDAMESRHGILRLLALLGGLGFLAGSAAMGMVAWTLMPQDRAWTVGSLSAQEVVLTDPDGIARGRMATSADGQTQLTLSDQDGRERIRLTVLADGSPGVTIHDPDARPRAVLGYLPDGTANLVFADEQGVGRAVVGLDPDGSAQALFTDGSGVLRTLVGVGADGEPAVSVFEGSPETGSRP